LKSHFFDILSEFKRQKSYREILTTPPPYKSVTYYLNDPLKDESSSLVDIHVLKMIKKRPKVVGEENKAYKFKVECRQRRYSI